MTTHSLRAALVFVLCTGIVCAAATQSPLRLSSAGKQVTLVELFTSEGCSSCPPADRWLSGLRTDAKLWQDYVPVAFHVDYWDYIGWRDRFAAESFSSRQRQYAREGGVHTVYTPGMFQNGLEWRGWYRDQSPAGAPSGNQSTSAGTLNLEIVGEDVSIGFRAADRQDANLAVHVAILGMGLESRVSAGENDGRTLKHDFVVLGLVSAPLIAAGNRYSAALELPAISSPAPGYAVAAWISEDNRQAPIQSVGGFLDYRP